MNRTTPLSSNYNGWFYDAVTPTHKLYNRGTLVLTIASNAVTAAGTLATGGLATFATAKTTGNHTFSLDITAGDGTTGSNGEHFTSGGAAAITDWV